MTPLREATFWMPERSFEPVRPFFLYAVLDFRANPPRPVSMGFTRQSARDYIDQQAPDERSHLRVRRGRVTLFEEDES